MTHFTRTIKYIKSSSQLCLSRPRYWTGVIISSRLPARRNYCWLLWQRIGVVRKHRRYVGALWNAAVRCQCTLVCTIGISYNGAQLLHRHSRCVVPDFTQLRILYIRNSETAAYWTWLLFFIIGSNALCLHFTLRNGINNAQIWKKGWLSVTLWYLVINCSRCVFRNK